MNFGRWLESDAKDRVEFRHRLSLQISTVADLQMHNTGG